MTNETQNMFWIRIIYLINSYKWS